VDHDILDRSTILTSFANVMSPEMVVWVVDNVQEEKFLEFDWHQVSKKI
jgi:hypothetical protein